MKKPRNTFATPASSVCYLHATQVTNSASSSNRYILFKEYCFIIIYILPITVPSTEGITDILNSLDFMILCSPGGRNSIHTSPEMRDCGHSGHCEQAKDHCFYRRIRFMRRKIRYSRAQTLSGSRYSF